MRGEYWKFWKFRQDWKGSPPLARGIQLDPINLCKHIRITPACAGNTREATGATATIRDHPRLRGEYIVFFSQPEAEHGSPPLARGIQIRFASDLMCPGITPACAGNTYAFIPLYGVCRDHPRLRGEYYQNMVNFQSRLGSPPLARGILCDNAHINKVDRITPACAGNTASGRTARIPYLDHPRLRGEYGDMSCNPQVVMGSPPLARGIPEL